LQFAIRNNHLWSLVSIGICNFFVNTTLISSDIGYTVAPEEYCYLIIAIGD